MHYLGPYKKKNPPPSHVHECFVGLTIALPSELPFNIIDICVFGYKPLVSRERNELEL